MLVCRQWSGEPEAERGSRCKKSEDLGDLEGPQRRWTGQGTTVHSRGGPVYQDDNLGPDASRNTQPMKADECVSDMVELTQVENQLDQYVKFYGPQPGTSRSCKTMVTVPFSASHGAPVYSLAIRLCQNNWKISNCKPIAYATMLPHRAMSNAFKIRVGTWKYVYRRYLCKRMWLPNYQSVIKSY